MATGFGIDPYYSSGVLKGTTSRDIRKVVDGMYDNQGILRGCKVTTASTLQYNVGAGALVKELVSGEAVLVPVYSGSVSTTPPTSGSRMDHICVRQNRPEVEGNSDVVLVVLNSHPPVFGNTLCIAEYTATANATKTSGFKENTTDFYRNFAIPTATAGRYLWKKTLTNDELIKPKRNLPYVSGSFELVTDRLIEFAINVSIDADVNQVSGGGINDAMYSEIFIDGSKKATFSTGRIDNSWTRTESYVWNTELEAGKHTFQVRFNEVDDTGKIRVRYGSGGGFPGQTVTIKDLGVKD